MDILVSSTYEDLKEERKAAIEAVDRLEHAVRMEDFSASNELSRDECLLRLRDCDAVVLLIGDRYGSIDATTGHSVTELEYRTAKELGLPVLVFLKVGDDGKWRSGEADLERREKLEAFKRLVESETTRTKFRTADDLKFEVAAALGLHAKRYGRIGVRGSVFQTPEQYFQKYLDPTHVFNHTFPLVGRQTYVDQLRDVPNASQRVLILPGAGGMGKSKILHAGLAALQSAHPDVTVCLLGEGNTYTPEHASELPAGHIVIVVDDAHRVTTGLGDLLALAQQFRDRIQLVLSTRQHGLPRLRQDLLFAGFDSQEMLELPEVQPLTYSDVEALATEILGPATGPRLAQLVSISGDSPLITVIAGQLFIRNQLDPALLTEDDSENFRFHVLARFRDELLGKVADELDPSLARKVLRLVATLTPLDPARTQLIERAAEFFTIEPDELLSAFDILERSGVLTRQAGILRIAPDVLSDHVLYEACFTEQGQLKSYGKQVLATFRDLDFGTLLQNMAELDWRVSKGKGTGLLQEAWRDLQQSYKSGSYQDRLSLLQLVENVAYFQPGEALDLVRAALQTLASDTGAPGEFSPPDDLILHCLAPILRETAYYPEYTREAASLLWLIGRDDSRSLERETEHPVRILQELAAYARRKPLGYNEFLFGWLEELMRTEDAFQHRHSPLEILPALLRREGTETWSQGRNFMMSGFLVDPGVTAALRRRVLTLMYTLAQCGESAVRHTVVRALIDVMFRGIIGLGNTQPTEEQFTAWQDEDRIILSILSDLLAAEDNPVVIVEIEDDLLSVATNPKHIAISADVTHLIDQLPLTLEATLIRYLRQGRVQRRLLAKNRGVTLDPDAMEAQLEQELVEILNQFFTLYSTPDEVKQELERLFEFLSEAGAHPSESNFLLRRFCRHAPDIMLGVCDLLVTDPDSQALSCLPFLLTELRQHNAEHVISCLRTAEVSDSLALRRSAAWASGMPMEPATDDEQQIIRRFALDEDRQTALAGIRALGRFPLEHYAYVFDILDQIAVGEDGGLANRICQLFDAHWGIDPELLPKPFVSRLLGKLVSLTDWSQLSEVQDFIAWVTRSDPESAATYYLARIAHRYELTSDQRTSYVAVPHISEGTAIAVKADADGKTACTSALRLVRDNSLQAAGARAVGQLTEVFNRLSHNYAEPALDVLQEWIDSGDRQKVINAARLLEAARSDFVFTNEAYVVRLLEMAVQQGNDVLKSIKGSLIACARSGLPAGWVGAPDPKDVSLHERALEVAQRYPEGHVAQSFYLLLQETASQSMELSKRLSEALDEE